jgi:hypothetical protein
MRDYFPDFVMSVLVWFLWGLFYEFMFRRSKNTYLRSLSNYTLISWLCVTGWMVYNLVMWRRSP